MKPPIPQKSPGVSRSLGWGWSVLPSAVILAATVTPAPSWSGVRGPLLDSLLPSSTDDWLDVLQNIVLFLPLGVSLSAAGARKGIVWLSAALISAAIELLQSLVPGRDPSARDVLANALGASLGALVLDTPIAGARIYAALSALSRWAGRPGSLPASTASRLSFAWALVVCLLFALPGFLTTVSLPDPPYLVSDPSMDASTGPLRIGSSGFSDGFFAGVIDEVRLYRVTRDAEAIRGDMLRPVNASAAEESDLVAAYGFDAGNGAVARDDTRHGHDGTIEEAAWTAQGRVGNALTFNGRSSEVIMRASPDLDFRDEMTLEAWVYASGSPAQEPAIIARDRSYFLHAGTERRRFQPAGGSHFGGRYEDATPSGLITPEEWTHLAVSYDGQAIRLYVNGILRATNTRWSPHRTTGMSLNGLKLHPGISANGRAIRQAVLDGLGLHAKVRCGSLTNTASPIFVVVAPGGVEVLAAKATRTDIFLDIASRAGGLNLPFPHFRVAGALDGCSPGRELDLLVTGRAPNQRVEVNGRKVQGVVPGPGSGWSFLIHSELVPRWIDSTCTFLWIALLVFPFALFARRRLLTVLGAAFLVLTVVSPTLRGNVRPLDVWDAVAAIGSLLVAAMYRRWRGDADEHAW